MSSAGEHLTCDYLTQRGQLVLIKRLIRFGQTLPANEFKVLLAIFDRTYGWWKSEAVIPDEHFLLGVSAGRGEMAAAPLGISISELRQAIDGLERRNAIRRFGRPFPLTYAINLDWKPTNFRWMWEVRESDIAYRPDETARAGSQ